MTMISSFMARGAAATFPAVFLSGAALAQGAPTGWTSSVDGVVIYQDDADLDGGGDFSATRAFLRAGGLYNTGNGLFIGLGLSYGQLNYEFSDPANSLWDDVTDLRLAVPFTWQLDNGARVLAVPQLRWDYEDGANMSDGFTGGVFAGVAWPVSDALRIGPAFGVFSQLDDSAQIFPALLIDWDIAPRWNLSTGNAPGATQGPGLTLTHALNDSINLSLAARVEQAQFRLDDSGLAPGGVGEDSAVPVVLAMEYQPNPGLSFSVFAGAEFGGELTVSDAAGSVVSRQDYDTTPIVGFAFRLRF